MALKEWYYSYRESAIGAQVNEKREVSGRDAPQKMSSQKSRSSVLNRISPKVAKAGLVKGKVGKGFALKKHGSKRKRDVYLQDGSRSGKRPIS